MDIPKFFTFLLLASSASAFVAPNHHGSISQLVNGAGGKDARSMALAVKRFPILMPTTEPLVPYKAPGSSYASFIGLKSSQLRNGKLWISQFIDDEASNSVISSLLYIQSEAKKERIELYLNIPGAVLRPALAIYDVINELKADGVQIATTNIALCAGMGALIAGAGTKGQRKSMPNARFLLQKTGIDGVFRGQASDIALEVANVKKWNEKINGEFAKVTGQPMDRIDNDLRRDFYLSSDEAVRYGLIDEVLMPTSSKRQPATSQMLDLGVFQSGQKYQGGGKSSRDEGQYQPSRREQKRGSDDDAPTIGKA
ncbi:hypothetical protein ACHAW6_004553 [Cyclotella cf. meneghiniana]